MAENQTIILLAEDDENDAFLLKRTLQKTGITVPIHIVKDGLAAIRYLEGKGEFCDRRAFPFPTVIFTDIKMPGLDGFDVLDWLKNHPECSVLPVVVWSSSIEPNDVLKAYQMGANCYMQKPAQAEEWDEKIALLVKFWEACAKPPVNLTKCASAQL